MTQPFSLVKRLVAAICTTLLVCPLRADLPDTTSADFQRHVNDLISGANAFAANDGQLENYYGLSGTEDVLFYTRSFGGAALFTEKGVRFGFESGHHSSDNFELFMQFEGLLQQPKITGELPLPGVINYYRGKPENWVDGVHNFRIVRYKELYDHMDVVYKLQDGRLKYDVVAKPGADIRHLAFGYKGVNRVELDEAGNLHIQTKHGDLIDVKPYSYQIINGQEIEIPSRYLLTGYNQVGFELGKLIDNNVEVVIDPFTVDWGTHIAAPTETNGTGYAYEYSMGEDGGIYGCGIHSDGGFPLVNEVDNTMGGQEATLFKVTADGTALEFATFIGGNGVEIGTACKPNATGELYFAGVIWANWGWTESTPGAGDWAWQPWESDFPVTNPSLGTDEPNRDIERTDPAVELDSTDLFFGKLAADGSLIYNTIYGGPGDDRAHDIAIDAAGNGIVVGWTDSDNGFSTPNAYIQNFQGGSGDWGGRGNQIEMDGFVLSYNPEGNVLNYCTYFGGPADDMIRGVAIDDQDNIYLCGATMSESGIAGPISFNNQGNFSGNHGYTDVDGFVAKFAPGMAGQIYGSYIGGSGLEHTEGIEVKCNYEVILSGYTESNNLTFPMVNAIQGQNGGARDGYWMRVSPSGASVMNSSFVGGQEPEALKSANPFSSHQMKRSTDIDVNRRGEIAFIMPVGGDGLPTPEGFMTSPISSVTGIPVAAGLGDAYIQIVDSSLTEIIYGTYVGGSRIEINGTQDHGNDYPVSGIEWHPKDDNYWAFGGGTHSALEGTDEGTPLPTTTGSLSPSRVVPGAPDQYYMFQFQRCSLEVEISATDTIICPNEEVTFTGINPCKWSRQDSVLFTVNGAVVQSGGINDTIWSSSELADGDEICVIFQKHSTCRELIEADTSCVIMTVNPEPRSMVPDTGICPPETTILDVPNHADSAEIIVDYLWSTGENTPTIEVDQLGSYFVTLTSDSGCLGYDTVVVGLTGEANLDPLPDSTICDGASLTVTLDDKFDTYQWNTGEATNTATFDQTGTYMVTVTIGAECAAADTFDLLVVDAPEIESLITYCNDARTHYTVEFDIVNGDEASLTINDNAATRHFTSELIVSETDFEFTANDQYNCLPDVVAGTLSCACETFVGTMEQDTLNLCNEADAAAVYGFDHSIETDDTLIYVLHTISGEQLGDVLMSQTSVEGATFSFDDAILDVNTMYYISAVAANHTAGGQIDFDDPCLDVASGQPVIWRSNPSAVISEGGTICVGDSVLVQIDLDGSAPFSFDLLADGVYVSNISTTAQTLTYYSSVAGLYTIDNLSDAHCSGATSGSAPVIINPLPDSTLTVTDPVVCIGDNAEVSVENSETGISYLYTVVPADIIIGDTLMGNLGDRTKVIAAPQANLAVRVLATDTATGCFAWLADTGFVQVTPPVENAYLSSDSICPDLTGTTPLIMANSLVDITYNVYDLADDALIHGPLTGNGADLTVQVPADVEATYYVVAEDLSGCTAIIPQMGNIYIAENIDPTPFVSDVTCFGLCDGDLIVTTSGGWGKVTLGLETTTGTEIAANFTDTAFINLCADEYLLTASDELGCQIITPLEVTSPAPVIGVIDSVNNVLCHGGIDGDIYISAIGGTGLLEFRWNNGSGNEDLEGYGAGLYEVEITDASNCATTLDTIITEPAPLDFNLTPPDTVCPGAASTIFVLPTGGTPEYTIDPAVTTGNNIYDFAIWSDSSFVFTLTDANGCQMQETVNIDVYDAIQLTDGMPYNLCLNESIDLAARASSGRLSYSYLWNDGLAGSSSTFEATATGNFQRILEVTDGCGSTDTAIFDVTVYAPPVADIVWDTVVTCDQVSLQLSKDPLGSTGETCMWAVLEGNDTLYQQTSCDNFSLSLTDQEVDLVLITSQNGCSAIDKDGLTAALPPHAQADFTFSPDNPINPINPRVDFTNLSTAASSYEWDFAGYSWSYESDPEYFFPSDEGESYDVTLYAYNEFGCHDTITQTITVGEIQVVWIPNTFTVDFNGKNDGFAPVVYGELDFYEFLIYDRWGELIWSSYTQGEYWDGYVKKTSTYAKQDVYTWKLTVAGSNVLREPPRTGRVTVVR